ncbi:MAG: hypothetical protein ACRCZP_07650 [Phycicoccus sp.]
MARWVQAAAGGQSASPVIINLEVSAYVQPYETGGQWYGYAMTGSTGWVTFGPGHPTRDEFLAYARDLLDVVSE